MAPGIFNTHKAGLGVLNIQGYERRNKESKNTMRRFLNNKGNLVFQSFRQL